MIKYEAYDMRTVQVFAEHVDCSGDYRFSVPLQNRLVDGVWEHLHVCNGCGDSMWLTEPFPTTRLVPVNAPFNIRDFKPAKIKG